MFDVIYIDSGEGEKDYKKLLEKSKNTEPYFLLDYINVFGEGTKNLICFYSENNYGDIIFMPGYIRSISIADQVTPYFDFITPYGYTGPFFSNKIGKNEILLFWENVENWYNNNNVVSEFIRFNLANNHLYYSGYTVKTMLNVKGEILTEEDQWKAFDRKVRKNINKAIREEVYSNIYYDTISDNHVEEFYKIYEETMIRTNAKNSFFYSLKGFKEFINNNPKFCAICTVYFQEKPISSELILISQDSVYSFLGGTNEAYFDKRPNDFLKVKIIDWSRGKGKAFYTLGGGYGFEDGIFKYKKSFFPKNVVNYYTGRKIINKEAYESLLLKLNKFRESKSLKELKEEDESFFPLYRMSIEE
ncbi:Acetyltransferase (GNAT) domain-containing protein [Tenacibaculum sp. MAR_2010_89]|uniref:GNAT family N-acetyltransferase n=1 Tax=Tenacibaculum sp. MAR_2010_89 TaxID=1250198 RepID=UPI00089B484F|nr:GNAT family N-acetyltransferase [Tenacibaculum sp. MAR_2010_89]SED67528.1 Acetyltransferase (GNAT) domain-containing protein [Tenacibaculum sp. MAR_2010_89]